MGLRVYYLHQKMKIYTLLPILYSLPAMAMESPSIENVLGPKLSAQASIASSCSAALRWSEYHAPKANIVVNVFSENDVVETVSSKIQLGNKSMLTGIGKILH